MSNSTSCLGIRGGPAPRPRVMSKFRAEVEQGFRDGVLAIARGQDLDDSVRAFAKGSVDLIGGGLNSLLGRSRRKD